MKNNSISAIAPVLGAALLLGGCTGALVGNIFVLCVSVGIFFGTLNLGRSAPRQPSRGNPASESQS